MVRAADINLQRIGAIEQRRLDTQLDLICSGFCPRCEYMPIESRFYPSSTRLALTLVCHRCNWSPDWESQQHADCLAACVQTGIVSQRALQLLQREKSVQSVKRRLLDHLWDGLRNRAAIEPGNLSLRASTRNFRNLTYAVLVGALGRSLANALLEEIRPVERSELTLLSRDRSDSNCCAGSAINSAGSPSEIPQCCLLQLLLVRHEINRSRYFKQQVKDLLLDGAQAEPGPISVCLRRYTARPCTWPVLAQLRGAEYSDAIKSEVEPVQHSYLEVVTGNDPLHGSLVVLIAGADLIR